MTRWSSSMVEEYVTGLGAFIGLVLSMLIPVVLVPVTFPSAGWLAVILSLVCGLLWVVFAIATKGFIPQLVGLVAVGACLVLLILIILPLRCLGVLTRSVA